MNQLNCAETPRFCLPRQDTILRHSTTRMIAYRSSLITAALVLLLGTNVTPAEAPPFSDYCRRLQQEIQGKKHGFLAGNVTYYVGGFHASWELKEHETLGLTHPFYHDLRSRGVGLLQSRGKDHDNKDIMKVPDMKPNHALTFFVTVMLLSLPPVSVSADCDPKVLPKGHEYFELRDGLANCRLKFEREKVGRIAFLGGSITAGGGWRDHTIRHFQERFPQTKFDFISAGISSMGSVPHAFRLERDVLSRGLVDLLFVEAAVNDTSNTADPNHMLRGMEGVVRHIRMVNPMTDIVHLHFVMPSHMDDYNKGNVPVSIAQHEKVAAAYGNVTLNLSLEVTERINAGEFTWDKDFRNLHPSPFGHQLYANSITRMTEAAFAKPLAAAAKPHSLPQPVDPRSYFRGRFGDIADVRILKGFTLEKAWKPTDSKGTRAGFVNVPALVGTEPGAEFEFTFDGTGAGLFVTAGPDAGRIEFSIDGGAYREIEIQPELLHHLVNQPDSTSRNRSRSFRDLIMNI